MRCTSGCKVCTASKTNSKQTTCLRARRGYSIIGGSLRKCAPSCKRCRGASSTVCTKCYSRSTLVAGACSSCSDSNALSCSAFNSSYSLTCKRGYTAVAFATFTSGLCNACAQYCARCNNAGPTKCDPTGCETGAVQLQGTTNCTQCFSGCLACSATDPNVCSNCGPRRYLDAATSLCQACGTGCVTCTTSATNCQSCKAGYFLVGKTTCVTIPSNCASVDASSVCSVCFGGYLLNTAANTCDPDVSCNTNSSCTICPETYILSNSVCTSCTLSSNCANCDVANPSVCALCNNGFYLDTNSACTACPSSCLTCDSATVCTSAADTFYMVLQDSGAAAGEVAACTSPCANCIDHTDSCLSCVSGYNLLDGVNCQQSFYLVMTLVFGPGSGANAIFLTTDSLSNSLFKAIKAINRIGNMMNNIAPTSFKSDNFGATAWRKRFRFTGLASGSITTNMQVGAGTNTVTNTATTAMTNAVANTPLDGVTYVSSSMVGVGGGTGSSSSTNLGLILGLSIPLGILLILVILILVKTRLGDDDGEKQQFTKTDRKSVV